ncbi:oxygenase MpaB family protein [Leucobacter chironomi]|uniref:oxygenase MpaB family protein n=1 Tax=Leucobacter chironomi TaxID=491918 RepID=UPI0003F8F596|nr:oxygenase MpaB family protein [Leucobacter chironomi]
MDRTPTPAPEPGAGARAAAGCPVAHGATPGDPDRRGADDGYFGPGSVSWRLFSDPSSKLGGVAALLLQSLNPMMMRVFAGTSGYASDAEGRAERTGRYIDTTVFGDRAHADAAGEAVQRLHAASVWTDPRTGEELRADTEEWLAWTHNAIVYGVLRAADAFGPTLTVAEQDRFVVEQHEAARIVGITDAALLPGTRRELDRYIDDNRDWMALTLPAAELSRELRAPALRGNPVKVWAALNIQDGILSLLPEWARLLFGIDGRPMSLRAAARVTRRLTAAARAGRSSEDLIAEVADRVQTHPYRRVRSR